MAWDEPDPEVIGGDAMVFNCGAATGAYVTTTDDMAAALESIERDNAAMMEVLEGRSMDERHHSAGSLSTEDYEDRETARDAVEAEVNERDVED